MLRRTRRIAAAAFVVLLTLLFLDFTDALHPWLGWLAKVQLVPAVLAVNIAVIVILVVLTLLFGRVYCSVVCPLGVLQDGISRLSSGRKGKQRRFRYSKAIPGLRYSLLGLFTLALIVGVPSVFTWLDPYGAYGRMVSNLLSPLYRWGNNLLAWLAERVDSYAFYSTEVWIKSWVIFGAAVLTLALVGILAWRNGRTYCNTICPVGTALGLLSRFSLFRPTFTEGCTRCGRCARACKSSCIDAEEMKIDQSRCVACFNCIDQCRFGAMKYKRRRSPKGKATAAPSQAEGGGVTRSAFLSIAALFTVTHALRAQQLHVDGGLAAIEDKKRPNRKVPLVPPGAQGMQNMSRHCTSCQLCVSACPNEVLRPSGNFYILMQPEMTYERGYCRPECTRCSQVCPTGAITPITPPEKTTIAIGCAVWIRENCLVHTDGVQCNACRRNCPTGAITQVPNDPGNGKTLNIPVIDIELCIGCGACEYICPARPFSAIYVDGYVRHHVEDENDRIIICY
jgi:polyferredoxin